MTERETEIYSSIATGSQSTEAKTPEELEELVARYLKKSAEAGYRSQREIAEITTMRMALQ